MISPELDAEVELMAHVRLIDSRLTMHHFLERSRGQRRDGQKIVCGAYRKSGKFILTTVLLYGKKTAAFFQYKSGFRPCLQPFRSLHILLHDVPAVREEMTPLLTGPVPEQWRREWVLATMESRARTEAQKAAASAPWKDGRRLLLAGVHGDLFERIDGLEWIPRGKAEPEPVCCLGWGYRIAASRPYQTNFPGHLPTCCHFESE